MFSKNAIFLVLQFLTLKLTNVCAFSPKFTQWAQKKRSAQASLALFASTVPEYSVDDGEDIADDEDPAAKTFASVSPPTIIEKVALEEPEFIHRSRGRAHYAALALGTVLHIQVGDVGLARKAWKKRRRSGSPLLIPCSVLNVDRESAIRWNLIYLVEKFGNSCPSGVRLSFEDLSNRHGTHLKSALTPHATAMGHSSSMELIKSLFNKKSQETYGVKLVEDANGEGYIQVPQSRLKAQKRASKVPILQFKEGAQSDMLDHTGSVRTRRDEVDADQSIYRIQTLSAALRASQAEIEGGIIFDGSSHTAVICDYDLLGDAGEPLLTLSLNSDGVHLRDRLKIPRTQQVVIENPRHMLNDLTVGDVLEGEVIRLGKYGAVVDCGVGRPASGSSELVAVTAYLSFHDIANSEEGANDEFESRSQRKRLQIGDSLRVYVKSVSKQSSQLKVTMDPSIQGKKAKDLKKETLARKKLSRLSDQLGGLERISSLHGEEIKGTVKAMSNTGNWLYVQPTGLDLPVGIATLADDDDTTFAQGDAVRVRLLGVDETRGQLSMEIVSKLSP